MSLSPDNPLLHPLSPLPQRLAGLLVMSKDSGLAGRVERWMGRQSNGLYPYLHLWLDDTGNLELRKTLGAKACEIIETENLAQFEEDPS